MHYVRFGTAGAVVSCICLGLMSYAHVEQGEPLPCGWTITQRDAEPFVKQALDAGITFFDTVSEQCRHGTTADLAAASCL